MRCVCIPLPEPPPSLAAGASHLDASRRTLRYRIWRHFNSVSTATRRHALPLPLSPRLAAFLPRAIAPLRPLLAAALPPAAPLVELSAVVTFPGADQQVRRARP